MERVDKTIGESLASDLVSIGQKNKRNTKWQNGKPVLSSIVL